VVFGQPVAGASVQLIKGDLFGSLELTPTVFETRQLLSPVEPPAIYCIGLNYKKHAAEAKLPIPKLPVLFFKPPSSVIAHRETIVIPKVCQNAAEVDYEAELAVVIGKTCKNVSEDEALDFVMGYTICNDVSARRWQGKKGGGQWSRAKAFDSFCPLGPAVTPLQTLPPNLQDPGSASSPGLAISTKLNGAVMQSSRTNDMIFSVSQIVSFLSQGTTLHPGTVIITGTPEGVGFAREPPVFLQHNDEVVVEIESIGQLCNPVEKES